MAYGANIGPGDWRQNPASRGYSPYSVRDLGIRAGYYDAGPGTGQPWNPTSGEPPPDYLTQRTADTSNQPYWMQVAQRYGINNVYLTPEQEAAAAAGQDIGNPFSVGAPSRYSGDDALQQYMADNPDYARRVQEDPMYSNLYNPDGSWKNPGQRYAGPSIPPGYRWRDAEGNPVHSPATAPFATNIHQTVQRAKAMADMMRQGLSQHYAQTGNAYGVTTASGRSRI